MSPETPHVYSSSFIRKSLAAVSKIGHSTSTHAPAEVSIRKAQSHRIFNLHLSRLKTSSPPRPSSKATDHARKPSTTLRGKVVNVDESLDDDGSISHEENSDVFRAPLEQSDDDSSDLGLNDSLETDNSATDLPPPPHGNAASALPLNIASPLPPSGPNAVFPLPPPGLNLSRPPRYPIIIPTQKHIIPGPGVVPPKHWAPGGGCNVRIEPEPAMHFLPRPGTIPPPFWAPGGRATRLEEPAGDSSPESSLVQDDTDGTISNSISSASLDDQRTSNSSPNNTDHIHAQLEHIFNMDDTDLSEAVLPGVSQSVWATCPTVRAS
ncbi:hypothetical protein B0H17DRAFT_542807 [Mycena rosella]|uniref:Uncharacterized protein n=1 Tax=Mycena rosella TaxID=1033263 RepID=A0AAD7BT46_MYCRO|nr:hypothetical protein B0H17DRAFT_542807 [Mycena rosella]